MPSEVAGSASTAASGSWMKKPLRLDAGDDAAGR